MRHRFQTMEPGERPTTIELFHHQEKIARGLSDHRGMLLDSQPQSFRIEAGERAFRATVG